jgi:hypothetical protein
MEYQRFNSFRFPFCSHIRKLYAYFFRLEWIEQHIPVSIPFCHHERISSRSCALIESPVISFRLSPPLRGDRNGLGADASTIFGGLIFRLSIKAFTMSSVNRLSRGESWTQDKSPRLTNSWIVFGFLPKI